MSLINQALRKAQRDRTHNRMPEPAAGSAAPVATPSGMSPSLIIGLVVAVAVLLGLVVGLTVVLLNRDATPQTVQPAPAAPQTTTEELSGPATAAPSDIAATATEDERIEPLVAQTGTTPSLARETTSVVAEELSRARAATEAQTTTETAAAEEPTAQAAAQPNQEIIDWLTRARVSGVRLSPEESRVIINGESYTTDEHVNVSLDLKLLIIEEGRLLFIDGNGKKYLKRI